MKHKQNELLTLCIIHRVYCMTFSTFVDNELSKSPSNIFIMTNIGVSVSHITTMIAEPAMLAPNVETLHPYLLYQVWDHISLIQIIKTNYCRYMYVRG